MLPHIDGVYRQDAIYPNEFESVAFKAKKLWKTDIQSYENAIKKKQVIGDLMRCLFHMHT